MMDIGERIERRRATAQTTRLVVEWSALSPVVHVSNPIGRSSTLERLLDALDPLFDDRLPPHVHLHGPSGAGKSAIVSALFGQLSERLSPRRGTIRTTTRGGDEAGFDFVYVDARRAGTDFRLYRSVLDALTDEHVPERGVGTEVLKRNLADSLTRSTRNAVVAVDHVGELETPAGEEIIDLFDEMDESLSVVTVGRDRRRGERTLEIPGYSTHELVDVVTERASRGLQQGVLEHAQVKRLAGWADGDAHDALAALFGAVTLAVKADSNRIDDRYLTGAMDAVPRDGVPLSVVLALPENRRRVLAKLLELDASALSSVETSATAIATDTDLSEGTVTRYLYELAEADVLERVATGTSQNGGRRPSRLEPRFPTLAFRALHDG